MKTKAINLLLRLPFSQAWEKGLGVALSGSKGDEGKCNFSIVLSRIKFLPILEL
jgi:hypothetical protein